MIIIPKLGTIKAMIEFEKEYTRDFTLIMGQTWLYSLQKFCEEFCWEGLDEPLYIGATKDGAIEYWANSAGLTKFYDTLLAENKKGSAFVERSIQIYTDAVEPLKKIWQAPRQNADELESAIELTASACIGWNTMYFSGNDERTQGDIRKKAIEWRERDALGDRADAHINLGLHTLYPELGELARYILRSEIHAPPTAEVLGARIQNFLIFKDKKVEVAEAAALLGYAKRCGWALRTVEHTGDKNSVTGSIAYKGVVRGRVRVLKGRSEISQLLEGEVLVTYMTTPDFLPAMHKAVAFVTDEGGIMCHAAIVAREMGKPCIIGTKFATQLFKDGDTVEVDAHSGVARKV